MKVFTILLTVVALFAGNIPMDYKQNFTLTSNELGGQLTKKQEFQGFGCNGDNASPQLSWHGEPKGTQSFAITMYDPDAPTGSGWWHWIVYDIPKSAHSVASNASKLKLLPKGSLEGMTDYKTKGFGGACPPKGDKPHRYIITIYALDISHLQIPKEANPALIGYMLNAHTIAKSSLISYYGR
jgi:Raf kinase inhibitor-like YbhB/YbcL family protein